MKVLKDPGQVLHIMDEKLDELRKSRKRFPELAGKETSEIYGQETAIIHIAVHIRHTIKGHGCFGVEDMACVYEYVDGAKEEANKYHRNPRDAWFMKGLAKGATWVRARIDYRMMEGQS